MDYIIDDYGDGKCIINNFSSDETIVEIPEVLDGNKVVNIDAFALDCPNATKIILPKTLESISYNNFYNSKELECIDMSKTKITHLEENVFDSCEKLKTVYFPACLKSMYESFKNCKNLECINLPDSVKDVSCEFADCTIKTLSLGKNIKRLDFAANFFCEKISLDKDSTTFKEDNGFIYFEDTLIIANKNIKEYKLPDFVHKIKINAFNNANIENLNLNNVERVESFAFVNANIKNLYGNNLTKISNYAFNRLHTENIELKNLTFIESGAFSGAEIENIKLNDKLTTICSEAFLEAKIAKFKCPENLQTIDCRAFAGSSLEVIEFNKKLKNISEGAFDSCLTSSKIIVPKSVEYIGPGAFIYSANALYVFSKNTQYNNSIAFFSSEKECYNIIVPIKGCTASDFFSGTNLENKEITTNTSIDALLKEGLTFKEANEAFKYTER